MSKFLAAAALAALMSLSASALAEPRTVSLSVPGMYCAMCPITVRMALEQVAGVEEAKADFETRTATVTFDTDKTTVQALVEATTNAGYPSTLVP